MDESASLNPFQAITAIVIVTVTSVVVFPYLLPFIRSISSSSSSSAHSKKYTSASYVVMTTQKKVLEDLLKEEEMQQQHKAPSAGRKKASGGSISMKRGSSSSSPAKHAKPSTGRKEVVAASSNDERDDDDSTTIKDIADEEGNLDDLLLLQSIQAKSASASSKPAHAVAKAVKAPRVARGKTPLSNEENWVITTAEDAATKAVQSFAEAVTPAIREASPAPKSATVPSVVESVANHQPLTKAIQATTIADAPSTKQKPNGIANGHHPHSDVIVEVPVKQTEVSSHRNKSPARPKEIQAPAAALQKTSVATTESVISQTEFKAALETALKQVKDQHSLDIAELQSQLVASEQAREELASSNRALATYAQQATARADAAMTGKSSHESLITKLQKEASEYRAGWEAARSRIQAFESEILEERRRHAKDLAASQERLMNVTAASEENVKKAVAIADERIARVVVEMEDRVTKARAESKKSLAAETEHFVDSSWREVESQWKAKVARLEKELHSAKEIRKKEAYISALQGRMIVDLQAECDKLKLDLAEAVKSPAIVPHAAEPTIEKAQAPASSTKPSAVNVHYEALSYQANTIASLSVALEGALLALNASRSAAATPTVEPAKVTTTTTPVSSKAAAPKVVAEKSVVAAAVDSSPPSSLNGPGVATLALSRGMVSPKKSETSKTEPILTPAFASTLSGPGVAKLALAGVTRQQQPTKPASSSAQTTKSVPSSSSPAAAAAHPPATISATLSSTVTHLYEVLADQASMIRSLAVALEGKALAQPSAKPAAAATVASTGSHARSASSSVSTATVPVAVASTGTSTSKEGNSYLQQQHYEVVVGQAALISSMAVSLEAALTTNSAKERSHDHHHDRHHHHHQKHYNHNHSHQDAAEKNHHHHEVIAGQAAVIKNLAVSLEGAHSAAGTQQKGHSRAASNSAGVQSVVSTATASTSTGEQQQSHHHHHDHHHHHHDHQNHQQQHHEVVAGQAAVIKSLAVSLEASKSGSNTPKSAHSRAVSATPSAAAATYTQTHVVAVASAGTNTSDGGKKALQEHHAHHEVIAGQSAVISSLAVSLEAAMSAAAGKATSTKGAVVVQAAKSSTAGQSSGKSTLAAGNIPRDDVLEGQAAAIRALTVALEGVKIAVPASEKTGSGSDVAEKVKQILSTRVVPPSWVAPKAGAGAAAVGRLEAAIKKVGAERGDGWKV